MQRILVLGAGFAGLWSAIEAARKLNEIGIRSGQVEIVVVSRTAWHSIRVRNYEADLGETRVRLDDVLDPIGVRHIEEEVTDIDVAGRTVACSIQGKSCALPYDRLVFALGSRIVRPPIPGLATHAFDIDTHEEAARLNAHIAALPSCPPSPGRYTVVVIGGGLTGVEAATEMAGKLRTAIAQAPEPDQAALPKVVLADRQPWIGSDMGEGARPVIAEALRALGIETRVGVSISSVDARGATLISGERIEAATVVWCAGMQADPLTARFPVARDRLGRLPVDPCLKVNDTTILDLGPWGAVYIEGRDRRVASQGATAKRTKETINRQRTYPPRSRDRRELLDAAMPLVQTPPAYGSDTASA